MKKTIEWVRFNKRQSTLTVTRNLKMARSAHAYVRGNTVKFYDWLQTSNGHALPEGPPIWICGDCHLGNLGPIADAQGRVAIQIRDLDQTVIGNPAHDLIRLGLSLAMSARGSDLPGVTTAKMLEQLMEGYEQTFDDASASLEELEKPASVQVVMKRAMQRSWKHLAKERIQDTKPTIPLGKRFWPLEKTEKLAIAQLFELSEMVELITSLRNRTADAGVKVVDMAYWMKGCSSLGRLRYAVLLALGDKSAAFDNLCLVDIKEAIRATAPRYLNAKMPRDNAARVVEGARHLAPYLGNRMIAARLIDHSVVVRELLPQDLKLEIDRLACGEAMVAAKFLGMVVGKAHARQMDGSTRRNWHRELRQNRTKTLDAPSWLWSSVVDLITSHEGAYLEHCRRYAMTR
ncbi:DUF2252 family protein [Undibacterium arcticum]|uniref:DUF2252 family protein n=1 Tax=Undibacterium arcticum TaxID=1762892 RepID=A0ABV7F8G1_9BURK